MSKELQKLVDSCSDWLITALENNYSDKGLTIVLKTCDKFHKEIDKGSVR